MFIDKHVRCVSMYFQYFDFLCTGWVGFFFMIPKTGLFMLANYHEQNWFLYIPSSNYPDQTMVKFLDFSL